MTHTSETVSGKFDMVAGRWVASVRCGGRGASMVGSMANLHKKSGGIVLVRLGDVVQDYGAGDVALFAIDETLARAGR